MSLDDLVERTMRDWAVPGLALALTDRERTLRVAAFGYADLGTRRQVRPETLFQLGSIGKPMAALAVLREVEAGRLDLHAPVTEYLPWFRVRSQHAPITLHHLLSHTSGLVPGLEASSALGDALQLAATEARPPGERYQYSNAGYAVVGLVLEEVTGSPIGDVLRRAILDRVGMVNTEPVTTNALRPLVATGYVPPDDRRPWHPSIPLAPAPWVESDAASGSLCSSALDLAAFARVLLNRGGGIVSEDSFTLMTTPASAVEEGLGYGYGIMVESAEARFRVGHTGTTIGYSAHVEADLEAGIAAVAVCNSRAGPVFVPWVVADAALTDDEPPQPSSKSTGKPDASGTFRCGIESFTVEADDDVLWLRREGRRERLEPYGRDIFYPLGERPAEYLISFGRDEDGAAVEAFEGPRWYTTEGYRGPLDLAVPEAWKGFAGVYRSHNPWTPGYEIFPRKDRLVLLSNGDSEAELGHVEGRTFAVVGCEEALPGRIAFGDELGGSAAWISCDGVEYYRFFTR
jgi:D-alanyl-D-alanine carboxypeptidase